MIDLIVDYDDYGMIVWIVSIHVLNAVNPALNKRILQSAREGRWDQGRMVCLVKMEVEGA